MWTNTSINKKCFLSIFQVEPACLWESNPSFTWCWPSVNENHRSDTAFPIVDSLVLKFATWIRKAVSLTIINKNYSFDNTDFDTKNHNYHSRQYQINNTIRDILTNARNLSKNRNIIITPSDKGGREVIMDTDNYIDTRKSNKEMGAK